MKKASLLSKQLLNFYKTIQPPTGLPEGVAVLYPQQHKEVLELVKQFLFKYFNDTAPRRLIWGINPGRLGAGITGVNFTAPLQLSTHCGIEHSLGDSSELSAAFVYDVIDAYGGTTAFYADWFIGSVCTLGFIKHGKNLNYYDDPLLLKAVTPFITAGIQQQLSFNVLADHCICLGGDKNYAFLASLNEKHQWFNRITALPHPRFIMQYKRKEKHYFIDQYLAALNA